MSSSQSSSGGGENVFRESMMNTDNIIYYDRTILSNIMTQVISSIAMFGAFIFARRKAPWVYYPNSEKSPEHPGHTYNSMLGWIWPLITLDDSTLLSIAGLDGFMFLQTLKLLQRICFIAVITVTFILGLYCYYTATSNEIFVNFSLISDHPKKVFVYQVILIYIVTLSIFYLLFIYYKRYISLRQLYMVSPSSMSSIGSLKRLTLNLPEAVTATEYVDIKNRAVVFSLLPSKIKTDEQCLEYVRKLGIGEIEDAILIKNTQELQNLYEKRDVIVQDIEKEVHKVFWMIEEEFPKKAENFGESKGKKLADALVSYEGSYSLEEKTRLWGEFLRAAEKYMTIKGKRCEIQFHMLRFREVQAIIGKELEYMTNGRNYEEDQSVVPIESTMYIPVHSSDDVSFFSLSQILHPFKNSHLFSLDIPRHRTKAFVIFKETKDASIALQAKIGTKPFSCTTSPAPSPHDVIWKNITRNDYITFTARILSIFFFMVLNYLFYRFLKIANLLTDEKVTKTYVFSKLFKYKALESFFRGNIVPLVYNTLLFFVPFFITVYLNLRQIYSFSEIQMKMMSIFSNFLFINAFLCAVFPGSIYGAIHSILTNKKGIAEVENESLDKTLSTSLFFVNTILQRMFVGNMMVFLKPAPFLFNFFIAPYIRKTSRQIQELKFSPPIDFGNAIPNALLIFPMVIVYMCFCPLLPILGFIFYFLTYLSYKNELVYASINLYESGGLYWYSCVNFIIYTVLTLQVFFFGRLYFSIYSGLCWIVSPLFLVTYVFYSELAKMFKRSVFNYPLNEPEENYLDDFTSVAVKRRANLLKKWSKHTAEEDMRDILPLNDSYNKKINIERAFYRDPALSDTSTILMLPKGFYNAIAYFSQRDRNGIFGFS